MFVVCVLRFVFRIAHCVVPRDEQYGKNISQYLKTFSHNTQFCFFGTSFSLRVGNKLGNMLDNPHKGGDNNNNKKRVGQKARRKHLSCKKNLRSKNSSNTGPVVGIHHGMGC